MTSINQAPVSKRKVSSGTGDIVLELRREFWKAQGISMMLDEKGRDRLGWSWYCDQIEQMSEVRGCGTRKFTADITFSADSGIRFSSEE